MAKWIKDNIKLFDDFYVAPKVPKDVKAFAVGI